MSQPINVSITMDAASFHKFRSFDLFRHQKRWRRPLAFTAILLVFSCICLSQVGVREGAALLAVVLAVVALGLPAVYFYTFFRDLRTTIKKLGLPRPFYRLRFDDTGLAVWMAGEQDRPEPSHQYPWQDLHIAYRTPRCRLPLCPADPSLPRERQSGRCVGVFEFHPPRRPSAGPALNTSSRTCKKLSASVETESFLLRRI